MEENNRSAYRSDIETFLRHLKWTILKPIAARLGGEERSLFLGSGLEVNNLREYAPGDDVRMIDWNVTAREGVPFIRQSQVERALDVWVAMDTSDSLHWGTAQCLKLDRALEFLGVIGYVLERGRHHIGVLFFAHRPLGFVAPGAGRNHLRRMIEMLRSEPRQSKPGRTNLEEALKRLQIVARRPSLIFIVSDFIVTDGWQEIFGQLAHDHEVVVVHLTDPREFDLPDIGLVTLEDPETGRQLIINTSDAGLRDRFHRAAENRSDLIQSFFTAHGVETVHLSTSENLLLVMVEFLERRKQKIRLYRRGTGK